MQRDIRLVFEDPFLEAQPRNDFLVASGSLPPSNVPPTILQKGWSLCAFLKNPRVCICVRAYVVITLPCGQLPGGKGDKANKRMNTNPSAQRQLVNEDKTNGKTTI
jgi:hypothetical protein